MLSLYLPFGLMLGQIQNEEFCLSAYFMTGNFFAPFITKTEHYNHCYSNISDQRKKKSNPLNRIIPCIWLSTIKYGQ